jgi:hypothetical protein
MGFKLKQKYEVFKVVDGPFAGKTYRHGVVYDDVPPQEKHKFDQVDVEESKGQKVKELKRKDSATLRLLDPETNEDGGGKS